MRPLYILIFILLFSNCAITHKKTVDKELPELGTIGNFKQFLLQQESLPKTIPDLSQPVRLIAEKFSIVERDWFVKEDAPHSEETFVSLTILDAFGLIEQINEDKDLLEKLSRMEASELVTEISITIPEQMRERLLSAETLYLVQDDTKRLSIQLVNDSKQTEVIRFNEGKIISYKTSQFCWGKNDKNKIVIFDLVPKGTTCGKDLYRSAIKTEKKTQFKFK